MMYCKDQPGFRRGWRWRRYFFRGLGMLRGVADHPSTNQR